MTRFLKLLPFFFFLLCQPASAEVKDVDPWEGMNRKVMVFNDTLDRYLLKPVARGYDWLMPAVINKGITNLFSTINEVPNAANALLQGDAKGTGTALARFGINATIGLLGFFDVAEKFGLEEQREDFGQTLAVWGVSDGPYLVLPFLGPSTLRDAGGEVVDLYSSPLNHDYDALDAKARDTMWAVSVVDHRADLLPLEELITGDRYLFFRNTYLQNRHYLISNGVVVDDFDKSEDEGGDWLEE